MNSSTIRGAVSSATLTALCETILPALSSSATPDARARGAIERGLVPGVGSALGDAQPEVRAQVAEFLEFLESTGFADAGLEERTASLVEMTTANRRGFRALRQIRLAIFGTLFAGRPEDVWREIGYPGPVSPPPSPGAAPKSLPIRPVGTGTTLDADAVVIGSGAGGSVIAARLAQAGRSVVVVESGDYRNESDFDQTETTGAKMYLRGGLFWDSTGQLGVLAGSTLGGGTVINSMVCLRPPQEILEQWAALGLKGLDGPEFAGFVDDVWSALNVNTDATVHNTSSQLMIAGLENLGMTHETLPRNAALDDTSTLCGYCNQGCQQGSKQSTLKNYLEFATSAGAELLVGCRVERIRTAEGRATGVDARTDSGTKVNINAPTVVVAAGGVESPAILLRSRIGGAAVGRSLRVHPAWMVGGRYDEPVHAWNGQIQSAVSFDCAHIEDGVGFLCETVGLGPAFWAANRPFRSGADQWEQMLELGHVAAWHAVAHDHGSGRVRLDDDGQAVVEWEFDDEVDRRVALRAHVELARMHRAAGAKEVFGFLGSDIRWVEGEDFDEYLAKLGTVPWHDYVAFSAHQMGSCRMGDDPATSVADGDGQLHDVDGVWVGDASALPTAPGVNPMITVMALAERTAARIVEATQ